MTEENIPAGTVDAGEYFWFDVAPGWTFKIDDHHVLMVHPMFKPLAIPLKSVMCGSVLPRIDDHTAYAMAVN